MRFCLSISNILTSMQVFNQDYLTISMAKVLTKQTVQKTLIQALQRNLYHLDLSVVATVSLKNRQCV